MYNEAYNVAKDNVFSYPGSSESLHNKFNYGCILIKQVNPKHGIMRSWLKPKAEFS